MLGREEILRLARARGLRPWQEEKRYVQALVLYAVSDWPVVMKGGTYLWLFHGLNRFSEDLDFTELEPIDAEALEELSLTLELFGLRNRARVLKDDDYTLSFRVSAYGPLHTSEKDLTHVRVDVSRRESVILDPIPVRLDEPRYGIPLTFLRGMDLREVLAEKLRALLVRGRARDLYDIWFLVRRGVEVDPTLLRGKLSFYGIEDASAVLRRIRGLERGWRSEIGPLVLGDLPSFQEVRDEVLAALSGFTRGGEGQEGQRA